ncbi:MAG: penicillin-binding protein 2 [Candidatus Kerfeldbacteria bacterium]|nr:penicillin-binding protein 2 [Candidatus Kerfeldbacteria bacterium]
MVSRRRSRTPLDRTQVLTVVAGVFVAALAIRLFSLQVLQHGFYTALAEGQHSLYQQLFPTRGKIFAVEKSGQRFPLATNEPLTLVYANPSKLTDDPEEIAQNIAPMLDLDRAVVYERLAKSNDQYEPLKHAVRKPVVERLKALGYVGIEFVEELVRFYPEAETAAHVVGFLGYDGDQRAGQNGVEGAFDEALAGRVGQLQADRDAAGRWIAVGAREFLPARDGDDVVLTIDRTIQHTACTKLAEAVTKHGADGGSVVVLEPSTGAVLAMCGAPSFDPNNYADVDDPSVYANPTIFKQYEPGSVMKGMTMAAAIDQGAVAPSSTYTDEGFVKIGTFTIRNSDGKTHGQKTMTQVLEESLNTGAIYAMRQIGPRTFESYLKKFGFGAQTDVELQGESAGDLSTLRAGKEIFAATASYGQGITVTPLQLAAAYGALANRGVLMKPYIVRELIHPDGTSTVTQPSEIRPVVSPATATTVSAMLVNVVKNGHGQRAGVPGYFIAGKTGTAQVPKADGPGYQENVTIGTFAGYGPVDDPKFVMVVRIDRPRDVQFAESSAAPLFGEIADFILHYYDIPPTAPLNSE